MIGNTKDYEKYRFRKRMALLESLRYQQSRTEYGNA